MRTRTAQWFECKIKYEKMTEEGTKKKVTELYVVDALSFSEAEARIIEEMSQYITGDFEVVDVKKAPYKEVFFADDGDVDGRWYKARLDFITIDERTAKEKHSREAYLVQAATLKKAVVGIEDVMSGTMVDYEAFAVDGTSIIDVFEYKGHGTEEGA